MNLINSCYKVAFKLKERAILQKMESTSSIHISDKLLGLVVCGGKSSRMGSDKSMLQYHSKPQCYHVYDMLESICDEVLISCNSKQAEFIDPCYPTLSDQSSFEGIGPMAALLSAYRLYPGADILLIGCDYPFLASEELKRFVIGLHRSEPEAFYNSICSIYEPLLAYYPGPAFESITKMYVVEDYSLQHFLKDQDARKFNPSSLATIKRIETKEDYLEAVSVIKK